MSIEQDELTTPRNGKAIAGIILLCVGAVLLLQQINDYLVPDWLLSPGSFLILWGIYSGAKNDFKKPFPVIMILVGALWLTDNIFPHNNIWNRFWFPLCAISLGFFLIVRRNQKFDRNEWRSKKWDNKKWDGKQPIETFDTVNQEPVTDFDTTTKEPINDFTSETEPRRYGSYSDDYLDSVSVFGGVKKTILSKDFKGGEIVNIFGGTELDLTQADINGRVVIDVVQVFGAIKLVVPPHWRVVSDIAAIFSGNDDKRRPGAIPLSPDKILVIKGVSFFAGLDIRSY